MTNLLFTVLIVGLIQPPPRPRDGDIQVGQAAPAFALDLLGSKKIIKSTDLLGKPLVLVFGSCM